MRPRRRVAIVVAVIVAVVGIGAWSVLRADDSALAQARSWVDRDDAWATALQSGETMAEIAGVLRTEAERRGCTADESGPACEAVFRTAAWAEVSAVAVLRCTRPAIFALRADARDALDALIDGEGLEQPPPLPVCG